MLKFIKNILFDVIAFKVYHMNSIHKIMGKLKINIMIKDDLVPWFDSHVLAMV